mmetsp:Transcript_8589/g.23436  ORF Transcript_8589/g.23436 Transcript_8589/m.23436 type:complete len:90 (+) Transcript_8589:131-400(+)
MVASHQGVHLFAPSPPVVVTGPDFSWGVEYHLQLLLRLALKNAPKQLAKLLVGRLLPVVSAKQQVPRLLCAAAAAAGPQSQPSQWPSFP